MFRLTLRNLLARKIRLLMSALAIVLGIGFLAGVLVFSGGLSKTFDGIIQGSTPDAVVQPEGTTAFSQLGAGTTLSVTPQDVAALAALPEVARADGSVNGLGLTVLDPKGKIVGTGGAPTVAFNYADTPNLNDEPSLTLEDGRWPEADNEIALDSAAAKSGGYAIGDAVTVVPPIVEKGEPSTQELTLVGLAGFNGGGGTAGSTLVIFDTPGAQKMFLDGKDVFSAVALTAANGVSQKELVAAADTVLPEGFAGVTGDEVVKESQNTIGEFLSFITYFLVIFALIAVIVGGFIIANTFSILVAQRVRELALLRALGASRSQVRRSVIIEALLMGVIGSTLGLAVGLGLARGLAALLGTFGLQINSAVLNLTPLTVAAAYAVGIVVTLVSAYLPARRASLVAPVEAMRDDAAMSEGSLRRRTIIGTVLLVIGAVLAVMGAVGAPGNDAIYIGVGAVIWVLTVAAISAVLGRPVLLACRAFFSKLVGTTGRLAGDNAIRNPRRTGATASALMIGLTLVSAVGVLAASMSASVDQLVDEQFKSDFTVQSQVFGSFQSNLATQMRDVDGVGLVSQSQTVGTVLKGEKEPSFVNATDAGFSQVVDLTMVSGTDQLAPQGKAIISESVAKEKGLRLGSTMTLQFPGNTSVPVEVSGIFSDTAVAAPINVGFGVLKEAGEKRVDNLVSINLAQGAGASTVKKQLDAIVKDVPIVTVQDKKDFAETLKGQVNQLLFMIYGLLALSVVIAIVGIVNTLSLSVIERTREIGLLRAVGLSRRRLRLMVTLESVTISVMGAVLGLVLGVIIGVLLQRALREDLTALAIPWTSLLVFLVISVIFGMIAAIVPAIRASRMKVLDAIATE